MANILLVLPVAAQIEPWSLSAGDHYQRGIAQAAADQRWLGQGGLPLIELKTRHHPAGQRRRVVQAVALRRQRQGEVRRGKRLCQIKTHMATAELMAGQSGGQQQQRRGVADFALQKRREGAVQRAQPATRHPAVEQAEQRLAAVARQMGFVLRL